jgi:hypothetical protein
VDAPPLNWSDLGVREPPTGTVTVLLVVTTEGEARGERVLRCPLA